jgi:hypothetical protein
VHVHDKMAQIASVQFPKVESGRAWRYLAFMSRLSAVWGWQVDVDELK